MNQTPARPPRQRGRASSERALVDAAVACFAEVGPNDVSVRAIAQRAGVNHGLVHHYFGSKAGLVRAVVDRMSTHFTETVAQGPGASILGETGEESFLYARAFARIVVDGAMPIDVDWNFPLITALARMAQNLGGLEADEARLAASQAMAMFLGWTLLEPWILRALAKDASHAAELRAKLPPAAMRLANVHIPH